MKCEFMGKTQNNITVISHDLYDQEPENHIRFEVSSNQYRLLFYFIYTQGTSDTEFVPKILFWYFSVTPKKQFGRSKTPPDVDKPIPGLMM